LGDINCKQNKFVGERREEEEEENPKFSISIEHGHGQPETT